MYKSTKPVSGKNPPVLSITVVFFYLNTKNAECTDYIFFAKTSNHNFCHKFEFSQRNQCFSRFSQFLFFQTFENFEFLKVLGKGTFGKVIMCREKATNQVPIC